MFIKLSSWCGLITSFDKNPCNYNKKRLQQIQLTSKFLLSWVKEKHNQSCDILKQLQTISQCEKTFSQQSRQQQKFSHVFHLRRLLQCKATNDWNRAPGKIESLNFCTFIPWKIKIANQTNKENFSLTLTSRFCVMSTTVQCVLCFYLIFLPTLHPNSTLCFLQMSSLPPQNFFEIQLQHSAIDVEQSNKRAQVALLFIHWRRSMANKQGEWKANPVVWSQLHPVQYNP